MKTNMKAGLLTLLVIGLSSLMIYGTIKYPKTPFIILIVFIAIFIILQLFYLIKNIIE